MRLEIIGVEKKKGISKYYVSRRTLTQHAFLTHSACTVLYSFTIKSSQ